MAFSLVEGPWEGDFLFKRIEPKDFPRVVNHIRTHFLQDEPTCSLLGYSEEFGNEIQALVEIMLKDNLSFLVEHGTTGELVALRITYRSTPETNKKFDAVSISSRSGKELFRLSDLLEKEANLFEKFGITEIGRFFMASCTPKYRNRGITTELYRRSLAFLKAESFTLAESMFTNPWTRSPATKLGFTTVVKIYYKDFKNEDGNGYVFPLDKLTCEHYAAIMVKVL